MSKFILMFGKIPIVGLDITENKLLVDKSYYINPSAYDRVTKAIGNFESMLLDRIVFPSRKVLIDMLHNANIYTLEQYAKSLYCIAITDAFWVKQKDSKATWEIINAFSNCMTTTIAVAALNDMNLARLVAMGNAHILTTPSPQYTLAGSADKCVRRTANGLYLYKSCGEMSSERYFSRPYSEWLVTKVYEKLNIPERYYVKYTYKEEKIKNGYYKPYSICPVFTDINTSLIEYADTVCNKYELWDFKKLLLNKWGKDEADKLSAMLVVDSLTLNIDRHSHNYGLLIDNKSFTYKGMAPIYDNDCALGSTVSVSQSNGSFEEIYTRLKNQGGRAGYNSFDDQLLRNMSKPMYQKLKSVGRIDLTKELNKIQGISQRRKDFIQYILDRRLAEAINLVETYLVKR